MAEKFMKEFYGGSMQALARMITVVENELEGYDAFLRNLEFRKEPHVVGITGPPGAGKSTLINSMLRVLDKEKKQTGIIAVDPTSPFSFGSLLGDRLRMSEHFTSNTIFIRSLATRGSLGGLSTKTIEVSDVMRAFGFDYIVIETAGVGQSEVEVAGLADTTVLVLVPESGDEVQAMKSGILEIADIFVVNKSDRPGADTFAKSLQELAPNRKKSGWIAPVILASALNNTGIHDLMTQITTHGQSNVSNNKKIPLLAEKAYLLLQGYRMKNIDRKKLAAEIGKEYSGKHFNLYSFIKKYS